MPLNRSQKLGDDSSRLFQLLKTGVSDLRSIPLPRITERFATRKMGTTPRRLPLESPLPDVRTVLRKTKCRGNWLVN